MSAGDGNPILPPALREGYEDGIPSKTRKHEQNASTGTYAAMMRALSARLFAFYFRAPVKAFFRARVDYMVRSCSITYISGRLCLNYFRDTLVLSIQECKLVRAGHGV